MLLLLLRRFYHYFASFWKQENNEEKNNHASEYDLRFMLCIWSELPIVIDEFRMDVWVLLLNPNTVVIIINVINVNADSILFGCTLIYTRTSTCIQSLWKITTASDIFFAMIFWVAVVNSGLYQKPTQIGTYVMAFSWRNFSFFFSCIFTHNINITGIYGYQHVPNRWGREKKKERKK